MRYSTICLVSMTILSSCSKKSGPIETVPGQSLLSEQDETVIESTLDKDNKLQIFVGFNDWSSIPGKIEYSEDKKNRKIFKGASIVGWSVSKDDQANEYVYKGKILPPSGWAVLWGDPGSAVDTNDPSILYYSFMAVSNESWEKNNPGKDFTEASPGPWCDSVCVARSSDGGSTFPQSDVKCLKVPSITNGNKMSIDHTSVVVDNDECVWISTDDTSLGSNSSYFARLFLISPSQKSECKNKTWSNWSFTEPFNASQLEIYSGDTRARMKSWRDPNDSKVYAYFSTIYIDQSALNSGESIVQIREYDSSVGTWSLMAKMLPSPYPLQAKENLKTDCFEYTDPALYLPPNPLVVGPNFYGNFGPSGAKIPFRIAYPYDFLVGREFDDPKVENSATHFVVRVAFQVFWRPPAPGLPNPIPVPDVPLGEENKFIQVVELTSSSCTAQVGNMAPVGGPIWGQAYQPVLQGSRPDAKSQWWLGYITNYGAKNSGYHMRTVAHPFLYAQNPEAKVLFPSVEINLSKKDAFACPKSGSASGYWGDYWSMTSGVKNTMYGAFSVSGAGEKVDCKIQTQFVSIPTSIGVSSWF